MSTNSRLWGALRRAERFIFAVVVFVVAGGVFVTESPAAPPLLTPIHTIGTTIQGCTPAGGLIHGMDGMLYGLVSFGGSNNAGGVYKISPTGGDPVFIYSFTGGKDGGNPRGELVQGADGNLYGTTGTGGAFNSGTVFRMNTNGGFKTLHSFSAGSDGNFPMAGLCLAPSGAMYGTTFFGGTYGAGIIFRITPTGEYSVIYAFQDGADGGQPSSPLIFGSDGNLYGVTRGGMNHFGTVFRTTTGGKFTTLYAFTGRTDGGIPVGGLCEGKNGLFYGSCDLGCSARSRGTVFSVSSSGEFKVVHKFSDREDTGTDLRAGLTLGSDGALYGCVSSGGDHGHGFIYRINATNGFQQLYNFSSVADSGKASARLLSSPDGNLYGTTLGGLGSVYKLTTGGKFSVVYLFGQGTEGIDPEGNLVLGQNGNMYGVAQYGRAYGLGCVYSLKPDGTVGVLYSFKGPTDGSHPFMPLSLAQDGSLLGITSVGGARGIGTLFRLSPEGNFTVLHSFIGALDGDGLSGDGLNSTVMQASDGSLYLTSFYGGTNYLGGIVRVNTNGSCVVVASFGKDSTGSIPNGPLVQATNGLLYGTTMAGGDSDKGTLFSVSPSGMLATVASFIGGSLGSSPESGMAVGPDGSLYGATAGGGDSNGDGVIFKVSTNGTLTIVHPFNGEIQGAESYTTPYVDAANNIYCATQKGSANSAGAFLRIASNGPVAVLKPLAPKSRPSANFRYSYYHPGISAGPNNQLYAIDPRGGAGFGEIFAVAGLPVAQGSPSNSVAAPGKNRSAQLR